MKAAKKDNFLETQTEIIELIIAEVSKELGLKEMSKEKVYRILNKNDFNIEKAMVRIKTNPIYYKKFFGLTK